MQKGNFLNLLSTAHCRDMLVDLPPLLGAGQERSGAGQAASAPAAGARGSNPSRHVAPRAPSSPLLPFAAVPCWHAAHATRRTYSGRSRQEGILQLGLCHKKLRLRTSRVCCFLLAARSGCMRRPEDTPSIPSPVTPRCQCQNHMTQISRSSFDDFFRIYREKQRPRAHRHHTVTVCRSISACTSQSNSRS